MNKDANERDMEELLLGSIFYCFQIGGKSRTTGSDQMAPIYTRPTWTRKIAGNLPGNIKGITHNILETSLWKQWSKVENRGRHLHSTMWHIHLPQEQRKFDGTILMLHQMIFTGYQWVFRIDDKLFKFYMNRRRIQYWIILFFVIFWF